MALTLSRGSAAALSSCLRSTRTRLNQRASTRCLVSTTTLSQNSSGSFYPASYVPVTSLSRPPWPEVELVDPVEERARHGALVRRVNALLETGSLGRLFAVVHLAGRQWKVTNEDLILIESHIHAACGERIRLEKVLLVGGSDFTLVGKPLLSRDLVEVEATVLEKTHSWPMTHMVFWKRHRFQKKRTIIQPQTVLRINSVHVFPALS